MFGDRFRPRKLGDDVYHVVGPVPEGEAWEFPPGSIVRVQVKQLSDGVALVAVSNAVN